MLKKLAVAAVALVLMTGALIGINLSMPRLGQSFSMPETLEGMGYRLDPFAQEQDGSVLIHIEDAGRVPDAVLVLAAMRPFEVEIQGISISHNHVFDDGTEYLSVVLVQTPHIT